MHAFSKELYDTMGVHVFILGCYMKHNGTLDVLTYDFNQELATEERGALMIGTSQ